MFHGSHQVRTKRRSGAHAHHIRGSWTVLAVIVIPVVLLYGAGYLAGVDWHLLGVSLGASTVRLVIAYAVSLAFGFAVALVIASSPYADYFLPVLDVLQNVPSFALVPLFLLLFGATDLMIVVFAASAIVWPILFYTLSALRAGHQDAEDAATIFGSRGWKRVLYFLIPLSLPAVVTGSIVGISMGWESVIGVEIIEHMLGIGSFVNDAKSGYTLAVGIIAILTLVFIVNRLVWAPLLAHSRYHADA